MNLLSKKPTIEEPQENIKEDNFMQLLVINILTKLRYHVDKNYKNRKEIESDLLSTSTNEHEVSKEFICNSIII